MFFEHSWAFPHRGCNSLTRMQRDWNATESKGGYRDGKNTRSYSDNYANGSPASKTTPAQPAPTTVALAHSLGGDHCRRGCGHDHRDHCRSEVCAELSAAPRAGPPYPTGGVNAMENWNGHDRVKTDRFGGAGARAGKASNGKVGATGGTLWRCRSPTAPPARSRRQRLVQKPIDPPHDRMNYSISS